MMDARRAATAMLAVAALLSTALAGIAAAGSHYPLSVQLWNQDAVGLGFGQTYRVYAQVHLAEVPANASTVTFRAGLGLFGAPLPIATYAGSYAGTPGLYSAVVTVTLLEATAGFTGLSVAVRQLNDNATSFRRVTFELVSQPPNPSAPWTISAGIENLLEIGPTLDPGERIVWRVDTYNSGLHANAGSLALQLYTAPHVDFSQAPVSVNATSAGTGVYTATTLVPAGLTESRQYVLRATLNEDNFAQADASADVWFLDTVVAFSQHDLSMITGELTVGDGTDAVGAADISLQLSEEGVPSHIIGPIQGQADAFGKFAFSVPNDGTSTLAVRGWINETGTHSQYVATTIRLDGPFTPPSPDGARFDAVPQQDLSFIPWNGVHSVSFQFFDNGTTWANADVVALVSTSRGPVTTSRVTTDANGFADVSWDFAASLPVPDDCANLGINFTFRASSGSDASSSDGTWWGEDEELAVLGGIETPIRCAVDNRLLFKTESLTLGDPLGVGVKYTGSQDVSASHLAALLTPAGLDAVFQQGPTGAYDLWTGHWQPFVTGGVRGGVPEFFAQVRVPSYWPDTTYTLLAGVVPHYSALNADPNPAEINAFAWTTLSPGQSVSNFVPGLDGTRPQVFTPTDFSMDLGNSTTLLSNAYDDSLDFAANGTYTWTVGTGPSQVVLPGNGVQFTPTGPGAWPAMLTVTDAAGNIATWNFTITVFDVHAPSVDAGIDFIAYGGVPANFTGLATDDDPALNGGGILNWSLLYNGSQVVLPGQQAFPGVTASFTFWTLGVYAVTLTAEDPSGNVATDVLYVTVVSPDVDPPTVDAGPMHNVTATQGAIISGTATDNDPNFPLGATCWWTFDYNGTTQNMSGVSFSFTFWVVEAMEARFYCRDFWGNLGQDITTITVDSPDHEPPVVTAGPDIEVNQGDPVTITGSATDNDPGFSAVARYWWIFGDASGMLNLSGPVFSYSFSTAGDFPVILYVEDGWGNVGGDALNIRVNPPDTAPPTIGQPNDVYITEGEWANVTAEVSDNYPDFETNGTVRWTWLDQGSPSQQFGITFSFRFAEVGNHTVTLRATDAAGNTAQRTLVVHVAAIVLPDETPPTVTASADDTDVVAGSVVTLAGSATDAGADITDGARFTWRFTYNGTAQLMHGLTPAFTFNLAGTYLISLSVTDIAGNVGTSQFNLTVRGAQQPPPPPPPPAGGDATLLILLALVVAGAAGAFLVMRRRSGAVSDAEPRGQAPVEGDDRRAELPDGEGESGEGGDEIDRDLDDLLN